jgi:predicted GH43/DUF377 family glycosyl hydrolase
MPINIDDKLNDFPVTYNADIQSINDELHFKQDGEGEIKYTGVANISGGLKVVGGDIDGNFIGTVTASSVTLSGGSNVEEALSTIGDLNNAILDQAREFERRADLISKITPSGFTETSIYTANNYRPLSSLDGLQIHDNGLETNLNYLVNQISLGDTRSVLGTGLPPNIIINGYSIKLSTGNVFGKIVLPSPSASGTRQDLVFIEAWKEEVDKETGLFFPFGNTQYAGSNDVDGTVISQVQAGYTGSAYFTSNDGVYCVRATSATEAFFANSDNNIGILDNGNYFQVRYRIRVEADVVVEHYSPKGNLWFMGHGIWDDVIAPQGQFENVPSRGERDGSQGYFIPQDNSNNTQVYKELNDSGVYKSGRWSVDTVPLLPISGLSLDGFTYAIPVCAIHRRNTGVYSLGNLNGTAFENTWICESDDFHIVTHGIEGQSFINIGSSQFKVLEQNSGSPTRIIRIVRISGNDDPIGTATWDWQGNPYSSNVTIISIDDGRYIGPSQPINSRPDALYSDIIDRRDVLDLRHKVSLTGHMNEDELYQETFDTMMKGEYRQEWEQQKAFDADGNELEIIESGIYGNVIVESLGLGATVPDAHINTNVTKQLTCNNGTPIGFNGLRTVFSDQESNENYTSIILDHSSPNILNGEDPLVSYNETSKVITINMSTHSSYVNDLTKDPTILKGHLPVVKWGNGTNIAGLWTRTSDYVWSFEAKEYGSVTIWLQSATGITIQGVYQDNNTNKWEFGANGFLSNTGDGRIITPLYGQNNYTLPSPSDTYTKISGIGPDTLIGFDYTSTDASATPSWVVNNMGIYTTNYGLSWNYKGAMVGYSNTAHGTLATESIFTTHKINYKAGSSCLPELPYGDDNVVIGAEVFISGTKVELPISVRPMLHSEKSTKTVNLNGFVGTKPVLDLGASGEFDNALVYVPCVIKDGSVYKMWYSASDGPNTRTGYATSSDGVTWTKQGMVLDLGANGEFDDAHAYGPYVIKDGSIYKMWYSGNDGSNVRTGYATSSDGVTWTKQGMVLDLGANGEFDDVHAYFSSVIKDGSIYKMWYSGYTGSNVRTGYATSSDGVTWTKQGMVLDLGANGEFDDVHAYHPSVIKDGSVYKMWYSGNDGSNVRTAYATSSDGVTWTKQGMVLDLGANGEFDDVHAYHPCVIKDGSVYKMWYSASDGPNTRIGYGVLAMSDPNNVGSSLTGVYTNTNPQINLGFKSSDSVVLHYERKALQYNTKIAGKGKIYPKHIAITDDKNYGEIFLSSVPSEGYHSIVKSYPRSVWGYENDFRESTLYPRITWIAPFDIKKLGLSDGMELDFTLNLDSSVKNIRYSIGWALTADDAMFGYPNIGNTSTGRGFLILKSTNGSVHIMTTNFGDNNIISYILGQMGFSTEMIGRPLLK